MSAIGGIMRIYGQGITRMRILKTSRANIIRYTVSAIDEFSQKRKFSLAPKQSITQRRKKKTTR